MCEVYTNTAVSLVELAREAAPVYIVVAAIMRSSRSTPQAGHPRLTSLHHAMIKVLCSVLAQDEALCAPAGGPCGA